MKLLNVRTEGGTTMAISGGLLLVIIAIAILAPVLATHDPTAIAPAQRLRPPSAEHWFGMDALGRDIYSRTVYGAQVSLVVGIMVAALATIIGTILGLFSGFFRRIDVLLMRIMDGLMSIPPILLAVALMALSKPSIQNVVVAITIAEVPRVARLVRGVVLSLREQTYIDAAVVAGARDLTIVYKHILPNAVAPIIVQATYICAQAILTEAALSFIGAGTPPVIPSWGNMMAEGRTLWQVAPHLIAFPALMLSITILCVNITGDALRDKLDPRAGEYL